MHQNYQCTIELSYIFNKSKDEKLKHILNIHSRRERLQNAHEKEGKTCGTIKYFDIQHKAQVKCKRKFTTERHFLDH